MTNDETDLIASARLDDAWPLVELFSSLRREHPDDGNRAALHIIGRLRALGVPGRRARAAALLHAARAPSSRPMGGACSRGRRR